MPRQAASARSSLVIQTSFLGDTVLTTPLLVELATRGPVDVVTTPSGAELLANHPAIRTLYSFDKRGTDAGLWGLIRMARRLRTGAGAPEARTAYLAQGSLRSATLALLAGCGERSGFATSQGRVLYTAAVPFREDRHHAERLWRLAFPRDPSVEPPPSGLHPTLYPSSTDRAQAERLLLPLKGAPFVALAPGSVWATKRWPYFPDLAARLSERWPLVVVGGPADSPLARDIIQRAGQERVVDATGSATLLASAELIARAMALVTNDSLPQHLASAMGTRTITLFGPTVPSFGFGPLAPASQSLGVEGLPCRPCHHHGPPTCPLGHWRCMTELAVEDILAAVVAERAS